MLFIRLGAFAAWIILIAGFMRFAMGLFVATMFDSQESMIAATRRYLGTTSSGEAMDQGILALVIGIALGLLVEIAKSLRR